jgi:hypothetical protein
MGGSEITTGLAPGPAAARRWWDRRWVIGAVLLFSTAPFWFVRLPPLIDLLGHLGRYHVQLHLADSPFLQRNWDFHWRLTANLGVDLLIVPAAALLGVERAAWLIALALPPLMIWGIVRLSRAVHGAVTPFAFAAFPFAFAYPYQYGFVNYWLSCVLALHAFASWVRAGGCAGLRRKAAFALASVLIWLAHAYGWAILVVLVVAFELSLLRAPWRPRQALHLAGRIWPVMIPGPLLVLWQAAGSGAEPGGGFNLAHKLVGLLSTLRDQLLWFDVLCLVLALGLIYFGVRDRRARRDPALTLAAAMMLGLILVLPARIFGSAYADIRLWPVFFMVALTAIAPVSRAWKGASIVAGAALVLFAARLAVSTVGYAAYDRAFERHLRALDVVPRGASIAVLTLDPQCEGWRHARLAHLGGVAIARKDAFVNSEWENPGALLLKPLRAQGTAFNADPSQYLFELGACGRDVRAALARRVAQAPRDRFDYVWLLGFGGAGGGLGPPLSRLYADDDSALYALPGQPPR